jgi:GGDEF domain-containing protein
MREKIILCVAIFCILVYVVAIGFGAIQIHDNIQEQSVLAETEYVYLKNLSVYAAQSLGFMTEAYKAEMSKALFETKTVQAFIISGSNNFFADERRDGMINMINGDPRLQEKNTLAYYSEALQIEGVRNPYINIASDLFDHSLFIITLKNTLLIILAAFLIVMTTLIYDIIKSKRLPIFEKSKQVQDEYDADKVVFNNDNDVSNFEIPVVNEDTDVITEDEHSTEVYAEDNTDIQDENFSGDEFNIQSEDISVDLADDLSEEIQSDENICDGPTGLYSPHGNVSWEEYTEDRLASELHRCASYEQEMVFIVMTFRGDNHRDDNFFNSFTGMAENSFGPRDMIFEWKEDGISIIVPNIDLDQAVSKCEDFHNRVKSKLLHASSLEKELCIGLSSRAGRLIDPDRLMFEASQALERAMVDPVSPIIAFKPDPEKYRAFIAAQNLDAE